MSIKSSEMIKWIKTAKKISEPERKMFRDSFVDKILGEPSAVLLSWKDVEKNTLAVLFLVEIKLLRSMFQREQIIFKLTG